MHHSLFAAQRLSGSAAWHNHCPGPPAVGPVGLIQRGSRSHRSNSANIVPRAAWPGLPTAQPVRRPTLPVLFLRTSGQNASKQARQAIFPQDLRGSVRSLFILPYSSAVAVGAIFASRASVASRVPANCRAATLPAREPFTHGDRDFSRRVSPFLFPSSFCPAPTLSPGRPRRPPHRPPGRTTPWSPDKMTHFPHAEARADRTYVDFYNPTWATPPVQPGWRSVWFVSSGEFGTPIAIVTSWGAVPRNLVSFSIFRRGRRITQAPVWMTQSWVVGRHTPCVASDCPGVRSVASGKTSDDRPGWRGWLCPTVPSPVAQRSRSAAHRSVSVRPWVATTLAAAPSQTVTSNHVLAHQLPATFGAIKTIKQSNNRGKRGG